MVCKHSLLACRLPFHTIPFSFACKCFCVWCDLIHVFALLPVLWGSDLKKKNHPSCQCYAVFLQFLKIVSSLMFKFLIVHGIFRSESHPNWDQLSLAGLNRRSQENRNSKWGCNKLPKLDHREKQTWATVSIGLHTVHRTVAESPVFVPVMKSQGRTEKAGLKGPDRIIPQSFPV